MSQRNASMADDDLWGAKSIAQFIGSSVDTVYDLAAASRAPIYRPRGRYYAQKSELRVWLRTKPARKTPT